MKNKELKSSMDQVRSLVNKLDGIAEQIHDLLSEVEETIELDGSDLDLVHQMECLQNDITEYQERKGYI